MKGLWPVLAAETYVVFTYRSFTLPVDGANVGAGALVVLGLFFVPVLLTVAAARLAGRDGVLARWFFPPFPG